MMLPLVGSGLGKKFVMNFANVTIFRNPSANTLILQFNEVSPLVKRFFVPQLAGRAVLCYPMLNFYM